MFEAENQLGAVNISQKETAGNIFGKKLRKQPKYKINLKQFQQAQKPNIGRRIIDISYFGKIFDTGCANCGEKLRFESIIKEMRFGLSSTFTFDCCKCSTTTNISTSNTSEQESVKAVSKKKKKTFAINVKTALGK